ncbi:MAG: flagellin [Campylobacter sp.]|nr:flagellin [Campylobacter sp.]
MQVNSLTTQQYQYNAQEAKDRENKALENIAANRALSGVDGANLAIADALLSQSNVLEQGVANANDAIGMLSIADSTLSNLTQSADKINELSVAYNSAALNSSQRSMLSTQANALSNSMKQSVENATFNGKNVFAGELNFVTGTGEQSINLSSQDINASIDSIDITNQESVLNFINGVNELRGDIGSTQNKLAVDVTNSLNQSIQLRANESQLQNNDVAQNVNEQKQADLQLNAAVLAQSHNTQLLQNQINRLLS